jgi:hypothetical protein
MIWRLLVAGSLLAAGIAFSAAAQVKSNDTWVWLASREIDYTKDADRIDLTGAKGRVKALRLVNKRGDVVISNVEIKYSGGANHNEHRNINLLQGDRTRAIDQRTDERFVDAVLLNYKAKAGAPLRGMLEIWGLQSREGAAAVRPATSQIAAAGPIPPVPTPPGKAPPSNFGQPRDFGEILFGGKYVGFLVDRDVIPVASEIGKFDRIRLRVLDNDIFVNTIKVVYANGETEEIGYNAEAKRDTRTRWIQLKGDRFIKELQLIYQARPNYRGQAYVEVYGQYAEGWLSPQGEGRKYNAGWVMLGAQTAGFTIDRNEVIKVGRNEGGFKKIRVNVLDETITLFEVRVVYGNGEVDIVPFNRMKIEAGASSNPIDLKGGPRVVEEIRPVFRTRIFQQGGIAKGRATVQFWGQH